MNKYKLLLITFIFIGCKDTADRDPFFNTPFTGNKNISIKKLDLDTFKIDAKQTSMVGKWVCKKNSFLWGDFLYGSIYIYDKTLRYKGRMLGQGNGPNEISAKKWTDFVFLKDDLFVLGASYDFYLANKNWDIIKKSRFDFISKDVQRQTLINHPEPDHVGIYEVNYSSINAKFVDRDHVIIPISTSHPLLNAYTSRKFYEKTSILGLLNIKTSELESIFGRYSPIYRKYNYIPQFSNIIFDTTGKDIFLGFEADSLLYMTNTTGKIIRKFGYSGKYISGKYPEVHSYKNSSHVYINDRRQYGFYTYLKCFPEKDVIFRGYEKDKGHNETSGLQIYRKDTLIGDVSVPKGMEVVGYIAPYFYAQIPPDIISESFCLFRFKLKL